MDGRRRAAFDSRTVERRWRLHDSVRHLATMRDCRTLAVGENDIVVRVTTTGTTPGDEGLHHHGDSVGRRAQHGRRSLTIAP